MSKYAYFEKNSGCILGWFDTSERNYVLPDKSFLLEVSDEQWAEREAYRYAINGQLVKEERPSDLHDWDAKKQTWVENKARAAELAVEQAQASIEAVRVALQSAIDARAKLMGFSGGNAIMLYASAPNAFQKVALQFLGWEVQVWVEAGAYKAEVLAGNKPMVSPDEAVAMMPPYQETS